MAVPSFLADMANVVKPNAPLAPFTTFGIGGLADALVEPADRPQLMTVVQRCFQNKVPLHVLGNGGNVLIRDEGVRGVVVRLSAPAFCAISVQGKRIQVGCGANVAALLHFAAEHHLTGLETLVGIPGTVGGAVKHNAGDRSSEIGQFVRQVEVLDRHAQVHLRELDELQFGVGESNLDDPVLLSATLELETDRPESIQKRILKAWIQHKSTEPFTYQTAAKIFKNTAGLSAASLIEQAGLSGTKVGGASVSSRNANYIVVEPGTHSRDVASLIVLMKSKVKERFHVELELALSIW